MYHKDSHYSLLLYCGLLRKQDLSKRVNPRTTLMSYFTPAWHTHYFCIVDCCGNKIFQKGGTQGQRWYLISRQHDIAHTTFLVKRWVVGTFKCNHSEHLSIWNYPISNLVKSPDFMALKVLGSSHICLGHNFTQKTRRTWEPIFPWAPSMARLVYVHPFSDEYIGTHG